MGLLLQAYKSMGVEAPKATATTSSSSSGMYQQALKIVGSTPAPTPAPVLSPIQKAQQTLTNTVSSAKETVKKIGGITVSFAKPVIDTITKQNVLNSPAMVKSADPIKLNPGQSSLTSQQLTQIAPVQAKESGSSAKSKNVKSPSNIAPYPTYVDVGEQDKSTPLSKSTIPKSAINKVPSPTIWGSIKNTLDSVLYPKNTPVEDQVNYNLQKALAEKQGVKQKDIPLSFIQANRDAITKELGVRNMPTGKELVGAVFNLAIIAGLIEAAVPTVVAGAAFQATSEAISAGVSAIKGEKYTPLSGKGLSDLLPADINPNIKTGVDILQFALQAKAFKFVETKSPQLAESLTKDITTKYNLPESVHIDAAKVADYYTGRKPATPEIASLLKDLGLQGKDVVKAVKDGVTIDVPWTRMVSITDKPYWAKVKSILGIELTNQTTISNVSGKAETGIVGYLTSGEHTPQDVIGAVIKSGQESTPMGKELIKTAVEAQNSGNNLRIDLGEKKIATQNSLGVKEIPLAGIDKTTSAKIQDLNVQDANTPVQDGKVRVYQSTGEGLTTDWAFSSPEELAKFKNNVTAPSEQFKYVDVNPDQLVKQPNGAFKISGETAVSKPVILKEKVSSPIVEPKPAEVAKSSVPETPIAEVTSIKDVKTSLASIKNKIDELTTIAKGIASVAQEQRAGLNTKDIAQLKRVYKRSPKFQAGDIQTIRNSNSGPLLNRVIEDIRIKYPNLSEQDALDFALNLPNKANESVKNAPELKSLRERKKSLDSYLELLKKKEEELLKQGEVAKADQAHQEWQTVLNAQEDLAKVIDVPRYRLPVETVGKEKTSQLETRVKEALANISPELKDKLGSSTFNEVNKKENIALAVEYVLNNPDDAIRVLTGEIQAPKGILVNAIYIAMEKLASTNVELGLKLASVSSTRMGQEISILSEINPNSPVKLISDIIKFREASVEKRYGTTANKQISRVAKEIKKSVKTPSADQWKSFIDSIEC